MKSKKFRFRAVGPDTIVNFRGVWAEAHCNDNDEQDERHGVYLALLRAMRGYMLERKKKAKDEEFEMALKRTMHDGLVKDWQRITAGFISFVAEKRGWHKGSCNTAEITYDFGNGVTLTIPENLNKFNASLAENEFVRLHRAELDNLITLEEK